ncbi:MAG: hypothetical protein SGCHY_000404 [Lobulomycetales sp.]
MSTTRTSTTEVLNSLIHIYREDTDSLSGAPDMAAMQMRHLNQHLQQQRRQRPGARRPSQRVRRPSHRRPSFVRRPSHRRRPSRRPSRRPRGHAVSRRTRGSRSRTSAIIQDIAALAFSDDFDDFEDGGSDGYVDEADGLYTLPRGARADPADVRKASARSDASGVSLEWDGWRKVSTDWGSKVDADGNVASKAEADGNCDSGVDTERDTVVDVPGIVVEDVDAGKEAGGGVSGFLESLPGPSLKELNANLSRALNKYKFPLDGLPLVGSRNGLRQIEVRAESETFVWNLPATIDLAKLTEMLERKLSMSSFDVLDSKMRVISCDKQLHKGLRSNKLIIRRVSNPFLGD